MTDVTVREARAEELAAVLGVLDAAALETEADAVRASIERDATLVAVPGSGGDATAADSERESTAVESARDSTIVGALVLEGQEITAIAVRRRRRGQGIGTALVEAAAARRERLVAEFDADVRPFYAALGFDVEALGGGRYRGERDCGPT